MSRGWIPRSVERELKIIQEQEKIRRRSQALIMMAHYAKIGRSLNNTDLLGANLLYMKQKRKKR